MSLEGSVTKSEMHPDSLGQGFPTKVRQRAVMRKEEPLMDAWESELEAILKFECCIL